jgi:16S rRNA (cytidine1402-2'-O)-methyltransferase
VQKPASPEERQDIEPPGTLYVVGTPIGNLGDLSPRAAAILRAVDLVAAEDTRQTLKLVRHAGGHARVVSAHAHSPASRLEAIVARLAAGDRVAVATDAGTPGVSDPGPALVALALAAGHRVVPVPGPSAVHAALSASGLPGDRYRFAGFAPRRGAGREEWLQEVAGSPDTVVCFEAPGRLAALLADLAEACGPARRAVVGRELTKKFEEVRAGALGDLAAALAGTEVRGECTVVVAGSGPAVAAGDRDLAERLVAALRDAGVEGSRAARVLAAVTGLSRNEAYRLATGGRA